MIMLLIFEIKMCVKNMTVADFLRKNAHPEIRICISIANCPITDPEQDNNTKIP
jgi:hypothetical protein